MYDVVDGKVINVFPQGSKSDQRDPLNMTIRDFEVDTRIMPHDLIMHIGGWAPELREYLRARAEEYARKTGRWGSSPGSMLSGDTPPPVVKLSLHNLTVREILNAIALYSAKLVEEKQLWDWPPLSWKYEFITDPNAPTGLGGYPKWSTF